MEPKVCLKTNSLYMMHECLSLSFLGNVIGYLDLVHSKAGGGSGRKGGKGGRVQFMKNVSHIII